MTWQNPNTILIRINTHHASGLDENADKTITFGEDMSKTIKGIILVSG